MPGRLFCEMSIHMDMSMWVSGRHVEMSMDEMSEMLKYQDGDMLKCPAEIIVDAVREMLSAMQPVL